jgi:hypothetical protein
MAQLHAKRHVRLALFGCVRCGRFLFAPSWYELDRDVTVCACDASRYKTTNVWAPRHVQEFWDAQCEAVYAPHRRRLKRHAPPSVHAERVPSEFASWGATADERGIDEVAPAAERADTGVGLTDAKGHVGSMLHAFRSALSSGLSFIAFAERENKGKT